MANSASWQSVYKRIDERRRFAGFTWKKISQKAKIPLSTWMTGLPIDHPSEEEVHKIAAIPELMTTYAYLRYGVVDIEAFILVLRS